ncbi:MAG: ATP-binding protein [candidate division KSB1 bacterium]|nr:ATP-binding protein [candidate division KSB1 bacterium]MDZ7366350.1 ATP-binding protein [candidate division KSB1 bacterium]MDZ7404005.1 ATP-binding protein [candidate division KSB1 bacterium]
MTKEYSPFTPGIPVPFEFFMGRLAELQTLTQKGKAALIGRRIERVFVSGPRGIGKSSFCRVARQMLAKEGMLGIHVFLGGANTLEEMVRRTFDALLAETRERSWFDKIKALFGRHIEEADVLGLTIRFRASEPELNQLASDFAPALRKILQEAGNETKGLFLILDDLNGLAPEAVFANWLKSFVDSIAPSDHPLPILLALVGLPERRLQFIQNQPSLDRVFDLVDILPLNEAETRQFYERAFAAVGAKIQPQAYSILYQFSGGFPVLMHEIGDATFKLDEDQKISSDDAIKGVAQAAEIVGRKYLDARVFDAIRSQRYRSILRQLAQQSDPTGFKRQDVVQNLRGDEVKVLDNFLHRMRELGVLISASEKGAGWYRFSNDLHRLYFSIEAQKTEPANGT